ncbi:Na/Pi cotransporter family protein [Rhodobacter sp. ETT8]|uniref:Na/Pi cotransporter family protein n=1 Tax=Pseudotabrizicola algicola TaxID=2709381 RepID=A0A6B3RPW6_9RHOB|nr:Na/Pi cotransporter family protein [Pseudotabrizicola algicola]
MGSTLVLIDILGAGALLLWGLRLIKTGMLRAFGSSLRVWIGRGASNRIKALIAGFVATLAVQSSTATAVIAASFAARDLLSGVMGQAVMLGANIGTSVAAAVLSLDLHWLSPLLILIGVVVFSRSGRAGGKGIGRAILGLGLMLLALDLLGQATEPMRESAVVRQVLLALGGAPLFALIFGTGLAALASSSLATVLFVMLLAQAGVVSPELALVLVAGANLGGAIPPYLAVMSDGVQARRLALTNLAVRAGGAAVLTLAAPLLARLAQPYFADTAALTLGAHIGFSLVLAVVFLPLLTPLCALVERWMPHQAALDFAPKYLDDSAMSSPTIALAAAARETLRLGDLVGEMLQLSLDTLRGHDDLARDRLSAAEDEVDRLHNAIKIYLARLSREELDADDIRRMSEILSYAVNLEHIGDLIDSGLSELAIKKDRRRLSFSPEGMEEISAFYQRTIEILAVAQSVFLSRDENLARDLVKCKVEVRQMEALSAERHMERLRERRLETVETSSLHLDILRDLKRVNAHLISVAYPILDGIGALGDTRLQPVKRKG